MKPRQEIKKIEPSVTNDFKMGVVVFIFFITCFHLYEVLKYPDVTIVPNEMLLVSVLIALVYLWIQEVRDRRKLEIFNSELLITQEDLKRAHFATITALIVSIEARNPYLSGHSRRVTQYALAIADKMNLAVDVKKKIEYACYLHDIGKIGIEESVVRKEESELDVGERVIMRKHPLLALEVLEPLTFMQDEKLMIRHHHERYDGNGYPDGLRGKDIPLGSRIIAVGDAFDIMNSNRQNRRPLPKDKIISEFSGMKGKKFDPEIVDIFLEIMKSSPGIFRG
ncbi:MAG: HD domain-containing protein [Candidatus Omnitrophica bacterium]|nr:HD domain-containing protein [Candidatus Omnitrophota bacterium]